MVETASLRRAISMWYRKYEYNVINMRFGVCTYVYVRVCRIFFYCVYNYYFHFSVFSGFFFSANANLKRIQDKCFDSYFFHHSIKFIDSDHFNFISIRNFPIYFIFNFFPFVFILYNFDDLMSFDFFDLLLWLSWLETNGSVRWSHFFGTPFSPKEFDEMLTMEQIILPIRQNRPIHSNSECRVPTSKH